jgi:hypothetical protein
MMKLGHFWLGEVPQYLLSRDFEFWLSSNKCQNTPLQNQKYVP